MTPIADATLRHLLLQERGLQPPLDEAYDETRIRGYRTVTGLTHPQEVIVVVRDDGGYGVTARYSVAIESLDGDCLMATNNHDTLEIALAMVRWGEVDEKVRLGHAAFENEDPTS